MSDSPTTYTTKQAADIVGVHKNTVLNWIRSGKIPDAQRDWKGYRVWTESDIQHLREYKTGCRQMTLQIVQPKDDARTA